MSHDNREKEKSYEVGIENTWQILQRWREIFLVLNLQPKITFFFKLTQKHTKILCVDKYILHTLHIVCVCVCVLIYIYYMCNMRSHPLINLCAD